MQKKKLLQIELNEFDPEFLRTQAEKYKLNNIKTFLSWSHSSTWTDDEVEHQGLDPWVQWVNVHTGVPSKTHKIKRLGDTKNQKHQQIWEKVGELGINWAAWGVMNAPAGNLTHCDVFMPDPWSFEETPYPVELNNLLALPRYMARNYLEADRADFLKNALKLIRYYAPPSHWPTLTKFLSRVMPTISSPGINVHSLATLLDYLGTLEFLHYRKSSTRYNVIFLNHIAHLQHQFWHKADELHAEMKLGLKICDLSVGLLLKSVDEHDAVIVLNALKQKNVAGLKNFVYRQINPHRTMSKLIGHADFTLDQCMTNDAHMHFQNNATATEAIASLKAAKLDDGTPLLYVESLGENQVFAQLSIETEVAESMNIIVDGQDPLKFFDLFETICERTGAHIQEGDVFARGIQVPGKIYNHEISDVVLNFFNSDRRAGTPPNIAEELTPV